MFGDTQLSRGNWPSPSRISPRRRSRPTLKEPNSAAPIPRRVRMLWSQPDALRDRQRKATNLISDCCYGHCTVSSASWWLLLPLMRDERISSYHTVVLATAAAVPVPIFVPLKTSFEEIHVVVGNVMTVAVPRPVGLLLVPLLLIPFVP